MNTLQAKLIQAAGARYRAQADFGTRFGICRMLFVPRGLGGGDLLALGAATALEPKQIDEALALASLKASHQHAAPPPPPACGKRALASLALTPRILAQKPIATPSRAG
uniref:Uncharacterized protein n=1 Tax=mine drainage metagenome TaxID=410659 RepID=E6PSQ8_9ZZZZ